MILRRFDPLSCSLKRVHASMNMSACALFNEQDKGSNRVERFVVVEMYLMLSANSEKCSDSKHHQREAGLFSKGRSIVNRRKHNSAGNKQSKTS